MKVTLERGALLKSLGHVHRVVERRTTIPILSNVLIRAADAALTGIRVRDYPITLDKLIERLPQPA